MDKDLANVPLNDVSMERVRVKEFGESKDEDYGWVNLVFLKGFSLKILSENSLHFVGIKGIYTGVCMECEESVFPKQSGLATWPRDLTESQVKPRANWIARLDFLSCSVSAGVTV